MHSNDARILRGAAIPTGIVGLAAILAGLALAGAKGAPAPRSVSRLFSYSSPSGCLSSAMSRKFPNS